MAVFFAFYALDLFRLLAVILGVAKFKAVKASWTGLRAIALHVALFATFETNLDLFLLLLTTVSASIASASVAASLASARLWSPAVVSVTHYYLLGIFISTDIKWDFIDVVEE